MLCSAVEICCVHQSPQKPIGSWWRDTIMTSSTSLSNQVDGLVLTFYSSTTNDPINPHWLLMKWSPVELYVVFSCRNLLCASISQQPIGSWWRDTIMTSSTSLSNQLDGLALTFNSLPPQWCYIARMILINNGWDNWLLPDSTEPLPEPLLIRDYWYPSKCNFAENVLDMLAKWSFNITLLKICIYLPWNNVSLCTSCIYTY